MAYHSHHMNYMKDDYIEKLRSVLVRTAGKNQNPENSSEIIFSSPVTGEKIGSLAELRRPEHWARNMTSPVLFNQRLTRSSTTLTWLLRLEPTVPCPDQSDRS